MSKGSDTGSEDSEVERINNTPENGIEANDVEKTPIVEPEAASSLCFDEITKGITTVIDELEGLKESAKTIPTEETEKSAKTIPTEETEKSAKTIPTEETEKSAKTIPTEETEKTVPTEESSNAVPTEETKESDDLLNTIPENKVPTLYERVSNWFRTYFCFCLLR